MLFKKSSIITRFILPIILAIIIFLSPPFAIIRSMAVMSALNIASVKNSVFTKNNFKIDIPGGLKTFYPDWYPFVMTFNDDIGFRNFTGNKNLSLSIMYNFPYFSMLRGCSHLFDTSSPYYGGFYGAYAVSSSDGNPYGFDSNGNLDINSSSLIMQFDLFNLVLNDFGLKDKVYNQNITEKFTVPYVGYNDWIKINAELYVNGPAHTPNNFVLSYLQYGYPTFKTDTDLEPIKMYGRVYVRHFKEYNSTIYFYIIASDKEVLEKCDNDILSKSTIISDLSKKSDG